MRDISFLKDFKYAHRGLHDLNFKAPENSNLAFLRALEHNYAIELDLSVTKDLKFVCFHDDNLKRMCNIDENIQNLDSSEVLKVNLLNTNEKIPLFEDVLNMVRGKVPLLIEIKSHSNYKETLKKLIKILDNYDGKFAVFSFDFRIVNWFKKNKPNYIRGQIASYFTENKTMPKILKFLAKRMFFNKFSKPDFISYNILNIPNKYIFRERDKGVLLFGYTAFNYDDYKLALNYLDNLVFEGFLP